MPSSALHRNRKKEAQAMLLNYLLLSSMLFSLIKSGQWREAGVPVCL
jgi:hypothetical protein